jgi:hypothetical protein
VDVTAVTRVVAIAGLVLIGILGGVQLVAGIRPRATWTIRNASGGDPDATDSTAHSAFNQGLAWADPFLWAPLQVLGSIGMLLGERWGFLLALTASVPFWYGAISIFVWDRAVGFRAPTFNDWVIVWAGSRSSDCRKASTPSFGLE